MRATTLASVALLLAVGGCVSSSGEETMEVLLYPFDPAVGCSDRVGTPFEVGVDACESVLSCWTDPADGRVFFAYDTCDLPLDECPEPLRMAVITGGVCR